MNCTAEPHQLHSLALRGGRLLEPIESSQFWVLSACLAWWLNDLGTRAVASVLRPLRAPLWAVLGAGSLVGMLLNVPTQKWRFGLFLDAADVARLSVPMP